MKYIKWSSSFAVLWILMETGADTIGLFYKRQPKVIGGREKDIREVPFMASLSLHSFICGGFLIDSHHVLTARHCLHQIFNSVDSNFGAAMRILTVTIIVRNKQNHRQYTQKDLSVEKIIGHPKYNSTSHFNDIAIIKIKPDYDWDDWDMERVLLPDEVTTPLKDRIGVSFGWGSTYRSSPSCSGNPIDYRIISAVHDVSVVNEIQLPLIDNRSCQKELSRSLPCAYEITNKQMCAGGKHNEDTCKGDSGGPLIMYSGEERHPVAIGIVSYGYGCGSGLPAIYTKVSKYTRWIRQVINS